MLFGDFEEVVEHVHRFLEFAEELFVLLIAPGIAQAATQSRTRELD